MRLVWTEFGNGTEGLEALKLSRTWGLDLASETPEGDSSQMKETAMETQETSSWLPLLLAIGLAAGCGQQQPEEVRARAFVLTDSGGEIRARLSVNDSGFPALRFYDKNGGEEVVRASFQSDGLHFHNGTGRRFELSFEEGQAALVLYDEQYPRVLLGVDENLSWLSIEGPNLDASHSIRVPEDATSGVELPESVAIPPPPK